MPKTESDLDTLLHVRTKKETAKRMAEAAALGLIVVIITGAIPGFPATVAGLTHPNPSDPACFEVARAWTYGVFLAALVVPALSVLAHDLTINEHNRTIARALKKKVP